MGRTRAQIVGWEKRWSVPVAIAGFLAVVCLFGSQLISPVNGEGNAAILGSVHEHSGAVVASSVVRALGLILLAVPLLYLFRAAQARSERVKRQLVVLVIVAPIFVAVSSGLTGPANNEAAESFLSGEAKPTLTVAEAKEKCESDRSDEGASDFAGKYEPKAGETAMAACETRKRADSAASNAIGEASLAPIVSGLGIGGTLGLIVTFIYCGLWGMRTGLLTRFWGSLGMVVGVTFLLGPLFILALVWLVYFSMLALGLLPGGRPPAWEAGKAVPWPTAGEKAAAELEPEDGEVVTSAEGDGDGDGDGDDGPGAERRKRKQRD
jgi:hypothetical protein